MTDEIWAEFTGGNNDRPESPDLDKLSDIVLRMDGVITPGGDEENDKAWRKIINECQVDADAVSWVALQRSMRACGVDNRFDMLIKTSQVMGLSSAWLDGFVAGSLYNAKYGNKEAD